LKIQRLSLVDVNMLILAKYRLLFMTYNGWIMLAVGVGAFVGYLVFGSSTVTKSAACH
jgi:hypothetical protein